MSLCLADGGHSAAEVDHTVADDGPCAEEVDHTVPLSVSPQHQDAGTQWED